MAQRGGDGALMSSRVESCAVTGSAGSRASSGGSRVSRTAEAPKHGQILGRGFRSGNIGEGERDVPTELLTPDGHGWGILDAVGETPSKSRARKPCDGSDRGEGT
jgi:hypothetical protein